MMNKRKRNKKVRLRLFNKSHQNQTIKYRSMIKLPDGTKRHYDIFDFVRGFDPISIINKLILKDSP